MKKIEIKTWLGLLIIGIIVLLAGLIMWQERTALSKVSMPSSSPVVQPQEAELFINFGDGKIRKFRGGVVKGMKISDALNQSSTAGDFKIELDGTHVEEIAGVNNNDNRKWVCYINGKKLDASLNEQELRAGNRIEFKFEKTEK